MRRTALISVAFLIVAATALAGERVPGERWMRYADPREAGFDPARLEAAHGAWRELPSSAFMVVANGAVVAAWGDTDRRFMCHSVRKSFLSALFGIYWDRGELDLNKTMADLGVDDAPSPLLESERQARILDLLKARSGVFHPAAYAGRTDSAPRGSKGAGRYFAYNNWDFNTLATILMQETGDDVLESFDRHFAKPLQMEDWRVSDGYYHYERDKSRYPAYPFRMSARDAARFGLLFTRDGEWGDTRILSKHWVRRSSALYSIDNDQVGYGFMWWVSLEPRFARHGMYSAQGVGNQMIAALPESDVVIVNRANTYEGEGTPSGPLLDLIEQVLNARAGTPATEAILVPLTTTPDPRVTTVSNDLLMEFAGKWDFPPAPLGVPTLTSVDIRVLHGHLVGYSPQSGTFNLYLQPDGGFHEEDSERRYLPIRDDRGAFAGLSDPGSIVFAAMSATAEGHSGRGRELLTLVANDDSIPVVAGRAIANLFDGKTEQAQRELNALAEREDSGRVENFVNRAGYLFLGADKPNLARDVFALNTRVFPEAFNTWDSLGEAHLALGAQAEAVRCYEKSLALNKNNTNAVAMIAKMRERDPAEN